MAPSRTLDRRLLSAVVSVAGFTVLARIAGAGKDVLIAYEFGRRDSIEAFFVAVLIPMFAINVISGALNAAVVPVFVRVRRDSGPEAAHALFGRLLFWFVVILTAVTVGLALGGHPLVSLVAAGFPPAKIDLTVRLFRLVLPAVVLSGLSTIAVAILNADEKFSLPAAAPIANVGLLAGTILALSGRLGVVAVAIGTVLGYVAEFATVAVALRRQGYPLVPRLAAVDGDTRTVIAQFAPLAVGTLFSGANGLVDQSVATHLAPGSVASLSYGYKLVGAVAGLATVSVGSAILPFFSRILMEDGWAKLRRTFFRYAGLMTLLGLVAAVLLFVFSDDLIGLLFQHGAFTLNDRHAVAQIQQMYALQIPFYMVGILAARVIFSVGGNRFVAVVFVVSAVANLALDIVFSRWMGPAGIALSTSCVYAIALALYVGFIEYKNKTE